MAGQVDFPELFNHLKDEVIMLAQISLKKFGEEAKGDALVLLNSMKEKLKRWTVLLANGDLTTEDFEWLVNSQKDLVEMEALKQVGLAAIRVDQFKNSVINMIVDTVFSFIKI
jgi:hypothetical protein